MSFQDQIFSCLIGGAIGDSLGYPIEFMKLSQIKSKFGNQGLTELIIDKKANKAIISDDTQMTLFTVDGMIWAYLRCTERGIGSYAVSGTYPSYLRWLYTQTGNIKATLWLERQPHECDVDFSILDVKDLYVCRAPGNTCISALESGQMGSKERPINNSKGCGGVMRVAPVGLFLHNQPEFAFEIGCDIAAITHGHPTGYLSAGTFSMIIAELINGKSIVESLNSTIKVLKKYSNHEETLQSLSKAINLVNSDETTENAIALLGEGWVAEEALAIAVYCALRERDFKKALILSVNHNGDSDSTGAICGNILGAHLGIRSIPAEWVNSVELSDFIRIMADRLFDVYDIKNK